MFVKLLKKDSEEEIILNVDEISSITKSLISDNNFVTTVNDFYIYLIRMSNNSVLDIDEEQYNQLCEVLTKKL